MGLDNPIHIALLLMVLLLVFGAKRLPEMGRSLGTGLRGFKEAIGGEVPIEHLQAAASQPDQPAVLVHQPAVTVDEPSVAHEPAAMATYETH